MNRVMSIRIASTGVLAATFAFGTAQLAMATPVAFAKYIHSYYAAGPSTAAGTGSATLALGGLAPRRGISLPGPRRLPALA